MSGKSGPDFHYLDGFQPIDLSVIGYEEQEKYSALWRTAVEDGDNVFRYEIVRTADCKEDIQSDKYRARIKTTRNNEGKSFTVDVEVMEDESAVPIIPSDFTRPGIKNYK